MKQEDACYEPKTIKSRGLQRSLLVSLLYLLYTSCLPELQNNTIASFADYTAILTVSRSNNVVTNSY